MVNFATGHNSVKCVGGAMNIVLCRSSGNALYLYLWSQLLTYGHTHGRTDIRTDGKPDHYIASCDEREDKLTNYLDMRK